MGCDIHMYVEARGWVRDANGSERKAWVPVIMHDAAYGHRNYCLFGVLAGVRDYNVKTICSPRGLPEDVSRIVAEASGIADGHSHAWLTLDEVLAFDWAAPTSYFDAPTCADACSDFLEWVRGLRKGPTRIERLKPDEIRLVFWFDS